LGHPNVITRNIDEIRAAERIIFPGVGAAGSAMAGLMRLGIDRVLCEAFDQGKPILGICLGTQIIMGFSEENQTRCLGMVPGKVRAFPADLRDPDGTRLKIPQMGWNCIQPVRHHPVLNGIKPDDEFYFVHGYYPEPDQLDHVVGTTFYGFCFASVIGYRNLLATQFHLEKSGRPGLTLLNNFCRWTP
jgi:glutamine amidotransferase